MNFVLRSSVNPAYEFDNLSEKQVHVGSGGRKTAAAARFPVAAPGPATRPYEYGVKTAGFRRCIGFLRCPPRERTRPGQVAGNQVEAWSIGNTIRELMLMKFSH